MRAGGVWIGQEFRMNFGACGGAGRCTPDITLDGHYSLVGNDTSFSGGRTWYVCHHRHKPGALVRALIYMIPRPGANKDIHLVLDSTEEEASTLLGTSRVSALDQWEYLQH